MDDLITSDLKWSIIKSMIRLLLAIHGLYEYPNSDRKQSDVNNIKRILEK